MARRQRVLGIALVLALSAAGCARTVSGDAGTAAVAPAPSAPISAGASSAAPSSAAPSSTASTAVVSSAAPAPAVKWLLPAPKGTPRKNNRFGNQISILGQTYPMTYLDTKQTVLRFVVDSIKLDGRCDNADKPANGHFLIISLRVQLGVTSQEASDDGIGFTADRWTAFDAKDVAQVGTDQIGGECLTTSTFPFTDQLEPGKVFSGKVALDVAAKSGSVVLLNTIAGGWVYHYG